MKDAWVTEISERYIELFEKVTGDKFVRHQNDNLLSEIENAIANYL